MFWWRDLKEDIPDYILFLSGVAFLIGWFFPDLRLSYLSAGIFILTLVFKIERDYSREKDYVPLPKIEPVIGMTEYELKQIPWNQFQWGKVDDIIEVVEEFETIRYLYYASKGQLVFTNGYLTEIVEFN